MINAFLEAKDEYGVEIFRLLQENFERLEFEFILEHLANLGQCPNLLNDDNGHWAFASNGYQNVVCGDDPENVETSFFVEAKLWKYTPREALKYYLFEEE